MMDLGAKPKLRFCIYLNNMENMALTLSEAHQFPL